ncbi:MAG TPA: DUF1549 and DUF1553 domain-containing protein, partial [Gemmataceae bacterium]|nr:DUF1549 and DUF1553 domain-containing protein [Gemmataceae bacterium]
PWPSDKGAAIIASKPFDLKERAKHWSLQPIKAAPPPSVKDQAWAKSPIDRFLLAKLEANGLKPAAAADRRTLIRRVTFDLTGLPPTPQEIDAFLKDDSPDAFAKVVDRLLDSPRYGERWARHWLDLVRYAETLGHEYDFDLPDAYRYRDYVIRALNADVPFDHFVLEHIAGDLLPQPRRHPDDKSNESICGTGFWFFGEAKHSPVDLRGDQADRLDNQIDVFGKTFLGLTIACARCHDHKFDAISTKDYYALSGYLQSARQQRAFIDDPGPLQQKIAKLKSIQDEIGKLLAIDVKPTAKVADADGKHVVFADFRKHSYANWFVSGAAFGDGPGGGLMLHNDAKRPVKTVVPPGIAHSGLVSGKLQGVMRSPSFVIDKKKIHFRTLGQKGQINLVIDGMVIIRDPIYGGLGLQVNHEQLQWRTMNVSMWQGHRAYIEFVDDGPGFLGVEQVLFSDQDLAKNQQTVGQAGPPVKDADAEKLAELLKQYQSLEAALPVPRKALAMEEGSPVDERVSIRGNHKNQGEIVPRRYLEVLEKSDGATQEPARLALAKKLVDPANPLTARVIVNRLWKHHFGEGLVRTPDDFGLLGMQPSHPELLDWLALQFVKDGWSLKKMHRRLLLTNAYQMASRGDPGADQIDPDNKLLHKMPIRRLEAEAIRDSILAVSGRLDKTMYGPGVMPHLTEFMGGRGRPSKTGPLDGNGRRSIYLAVRRNFLSPMLLAFDFPVPFSTIGKRSVSNVPAQALTMLNNPFVLEQADVWGKQVVADKGLGTKERIIKMHETALGRPPSEVELREMLAFIEEQGRFYGNVEDRRVWADLGHVLLNVKEFIFVR